ncbi:MAG: GerMN domain-containing protein [Peptostreptococcaceae bacterium]
MKKLFNFIIIIFILPLILVGCSTTLDNSISKAEKVTATIYISDSQGENLIDKEVNIKEVAANSLFNELKFHNVIPKDTKLNSFDKFIDNNENIGIINFSKEFYDFNLGSSGEVLMLNSIAKTYLENLNLDKFKILVDGEEYQSGHILYEKEDYFTLDSIN